MKTISVRQPWAWAIIFGGKDVENRNKAPIGTASLVGHRIGIHAAKGMTQHEYESAHDYMQKLGVDCPRPNHLHRGGLIGSVRLTDVVSERPSRWFFGPRGLVIDQAEAIEPVAGPGQLGWFTFKPSGAFDDPKLWMQHWPDRAPRVGLPTPSPPVETIDMFSDGDTFSDACELFSDIARAALRSEP